MTRPSRVYHKCIVRMYRFFFFFRSRFYFPASEQVVDTGVVPSSPRFLPSIFIAHRVQQSHCSSSLHRVLLTHALALSASQLMHKKKFQRIYTRMHSAGLELTKLTYTRFEYNLIRHRGDRRPLYVITGQADALEIHATVWSPAETESIFFSSSFLLSVIGQQNVPRTPEAVKRREAGRGLAVKFGGGHCQSALRGWPLRKEEPSIYRKDAVAFSDYVFCFCFSYSAPT